jgi:hypothetical protein
MGELYEYIDSWDGPTLFVYLVIIFFIILFFCKSSAQINFLIGIIIAAFVISYLNNRAIVAADTDADIKKIKQDSLVPKLNKEAIEHDNLLSMLFSVQDIYQYNPQQYEVMIKSINMFYKLYKLSFVDESTVFVNYGMMEQYKRDALNALASMIYSLPIDKNIRDKINVSAVALDNIMSTHLDQVGFLIDDRIYKHGYDVNTKIISNGPKPFNEYDDIFGNFSYEIY